MKSHGWTAKPTDGPLGDLPWDIHLDKTLQRMPNPSTSLHPRVQRVFTAAVIIAALLTPPVKAATPPVIDDARFHAADDLIAAAIKSGDIPGAVLLVGQNDRVVYRKTYGHRSIEPVKHAMTTDTVFDLASVTKPVAAATSIMILVDRGKLRVTDRVSDHLPGFGVNGKADITVEQLLIHTSGLTPDNHLRDYGHGPAKAINRILSLKPTWTPGSRFKYSDVGYMVLGMIVQKIDGRPLDLFLRDELCAPLSMNATSYNPPASWRPRIAPTTQREGATGKRWLIGEVHDPRAIALGGVAGHAGLFSTADDLARYCRILIHGGTLDGRRVMSEATVRDMLSPRTIKRVGRDGLDRRSLGFDVDTGYSSARGDRFARGTTFGHTGFTGPAIWIDRPNKCYYVFLCSRLHPDGKGNVLRLRREIATVVAKALLDQKQ